MTLGEWVKKRGLTLQQAAPLLGYHHSSGLSAAILGWTFPRPRLIRSILKATDGEVTLEDLFRVWDERHKGPYVKKQFERRSHHQNM